MKIIKASKLDDIRKARDEWDANYKASKARHDQQEQKYEEARWEIEKRITDYIKNELSKFDVLEFEVSASPRYKHVSARISCGEANKFEDYVALAWDYRIDYKYGSDEPTIETGSWSGLSATKPEQITWLEQSIEAIKYLNSVDWDKLLTPEDMPHYSDYVTEEVPTNRPNFEAEEFNLQLADLVGSNKLVRGAASPNGYISEGVDGWYKIERETPKYYKVGFAPANWYTDNPTDDQDRVMVNRFIDYLNTTYKLRKDRAKNYIKSPIETMEMPEKL